MIIKFIFVKIIIVMKYLALTIFVLFISLTHVNAQDYLQYVKQEMSNIEQLLSLDENSKDLVLTNEQKVKINDILKKKSKRALAISNSGKSKLEISNELTELDKQFTPQVAAVLKENQRLVYLEKRSIYSPFK